MKIIFNPFYDSHVYMDLEARGSLIGEKYAGGTELVEELRLRVGLTSLNPDPMERTARYMKAIRATLDSGKDTYAEIFRSSFAKDELGVSMTLLGWRDILVAQGWAPEDYTTSPKLNALTDIEKYFDCQGPADYKRELLEYLTEDQTSLKSITIESILPSDKLPSYYRRLLNAASQCGADVKYMPAPEAAAAEGTALRAIQEYLLYGTPAKVSQDESLKVYRFQNTDEALKYAALKNTGIISSQETVMLREIFRAMNLPLPKTTDESVPQVVKLLPLAIALRKADIDVSSLLAFLSIEPNPLSSLKVKVINGEQEWYVSLNRILRNHLLSNGGLDKYWYEVLEGELYNSEGEIRKPADRRAIELISQVGFSKGKISKEDLKDLIKLLKTWAQRNLETRGALVSYCGFTELLAEDLKGEAEVDYVLRWLSSAGSPTIRTVMPAELGSCEVVDSPSAVADPVSTLYWADCWTAGKGTAELDFLSPADIAELGIETDTGKVTYEAMRYALAIGISKIKDSLVILTCDNKDGEPVQEHPVLIELKSCCSLTEDKPSEHLYDAKFPVIGLADRGFQHVVDKSRFENLRIPKAEGGLKRSKESYTSLSTLINYPFDYVMNYVLHWEAYGIDSMSDIATVKGIVAHRYIEYLLLHSENDIAKAKELHKAQYAKRIEECIREKGVSMYMDENRLEASSFKAALNPAVDTLLDFIQKNNLAVEDMEYAINTHLPVIGDFTGSVDLLLKDSKGNNVVVDMKWNEGKSYNRRLESGNTLQLALYKKALETEGRTVSSVGYFVLPQRKFLTSDTFLLPSDLVEHINGAFTGDHFQMACNSYEYRMAQIESGLIEDADGKELANIQYHKDSIPMQLYPLDTDYNNPTLKSSPYGTPNLILKGGLE